MNEIALKIDQTIKENKFKAGEILPSIEEFASKFGSTVEEVKQAIGDLIYEGVLERVPSERDKVRVRAKYLWDVVGGNHSFTKEAKKRNQKPGNKILTFEKRKVWPQIMERLKLEKDEEVIVLERLLFADDMPVGLEFSYMPAKYYEGVTREIFEGGKSTFAVMEERGLIPDTAVDELSVATLEEREAALLGMEPGVPVLIRFRVTLTPEGIPVKGSRAIYLFKPSYSLKL